MGVWEGALWARCVGDVAGLSTPIHPYTASEKLVLAQDRRDCSAGFVGNGLERRAGMRLADAHQLECGFEAGDRRAEAGDAEEIEDAALESVGLLDVAAA